MLEDGCWIGPNVVLTNAKYPLSPGVKDSLAGPVIRQGRKDRCERDDPARRRRRRERAGRRRCGRRPRRAAGAVVAGNPARVIGQVTDLPYALPPSTRQSALNTFGNPSH